MAGFSRLQKEEMQWYVDRSKRKRMESFYRQVTEPAEYGSDLNIDWQELYRRAICMGYWHSSFNAAFARKLVDNSSVSIAIPAGAGKNVTVLYKILQDKTIPWRKKVTIVTYLVHNPMADPGRLQGLSDYRIILESKC